MQTVNNEDNPHNQARYYHEHTDTEHPHLDYLEHPRHVHPHAQLACNHTGGFGYY
ncbi:MAG: hypothetical protein JOZ73_11410 [Solirubrobacterales bacterium]|nr:hypothetical protein [Solirubrobacterales bacterium]